MALVDGRVQVSSPIEDYALIGNLRTAALVDRTGSIDWLCLPRFDSGACFAALLGDEKNGRWLLAPQGGVKQVRRKYRDETLILETEFETESGVATVIDFMPIAERPERVDVIRIVKGIRGQVPMRTEIIFRFDYGRTIPWVRKRDYGLSAVSGPSAIALRTAVPLSSKDYTTFGEFTISEGQSETFRLTCYPSHEDEPGDADPLRMLSATEQRWRDWAGRCSLPGRMARSGGAVADHAKGSHIYADWRYHCGADDVSAGESRRSAQLGLSILLAARFYFHALRTIDFWLYR